MESIRFVIVFNGEIYNHRELRGDLDFDWQGDSDTETLIRHYLGSLEVEKGISMLQWYVCHWATRLG